jgi:hypothetical protein
VSIILTQEGYPGGRILSPRMHANEHEYLYLNIR